LLCPPPLLQTDVPFGFWSLTTVQLRCSWGQPTMRVSLHCFKGSHQGTLLNNCCICAKGFQVLSCGSRRPSKDLTMGGGYPLIITPCRLCCRVVAPPTVLHEGREHPARGLSCLQQETSNAALLMSTTNSTPPARWRQQRLQSRGHSLVIQQNHSSVDDLTITSVGKPLGWEAPNQQMHRHSDIRGLLWVWKGGIDRRGREGGDGNSHKHVVVCILLSTKEVRKPDG